MIKSESFVVADWTDPGTHPGRPIAGLHLHRSDDEAWIVLSGRLGFRVGDEERELGPGGTWRIGPDIPHEVVAGPDGAEVLDVFAPARDDWASLERQAPAAPRWP